MQYWEDVKQGKYDIPYGMTKEEYLQYLEGLKKVKEKQILDQVDYDKILEERKKQFYREWANTIEKSAVEHSNIGDFTINPKTGKIQKMKGGGHGQANIDFLEQNGIEYNIEHTYSNGVRIGNVPGHKVKPKRTGSNQSWFPESWNEKDIANAGGYVGNLGNNANVADGIVVYGEYNGVRVGVIRTNGKISTIFPDATIQP